VSELDADEAAVVELVRTWVDRGILYPAARAGSSRLGWNWSIVMDGVGPR